MALVLAWPSERRKPLRLRLVALAEELEKLVGEYVAERRNGIRRCRGKSFRSSRESSRHVIRDWQRVLQAFLDHAVALAPVAAKRDALEEVLNRALDLKARQDSHTATRQQITQELDEVLEEGREQARQIRGIVKGILGTRNERLVQFDIAPLRRHSRKPNLPEIPPATE